MQHETKGRSHRKQSSTSELLDWVRILTAQTEKEATQAINNLFSDTAQLGILLKSQIDIDNILAKLSDSSEKRDK